MNADPAPRAAALPAPAVASGWEHLSRDTGPTTGTLVGRTFRLWAANLGKLSLMILIMALPFVLAFAGAFGTLSLQARGGGGTLPPALFWVLLSVGGVAALFVMATAFCGIQLGAHRWAAGQQAGLGEVLRRGLGAALPAILAGLLVALATMLGYVLLVVPGIMVAVATSLALPAVVVERLGPVAAFQRSLELTRGYRWSLFGCFFIMFALQLALSLVGTALQLVAPVAGTIFSLLLSFFGYSLPWVLTGVAFHDLRVAKEGADTSTLDQVFG